MKKLFAILILVLLPACAWADTAKIGDCSDCTGGFADNYVSTDTPANNHGAQTFFIVGNNGGVIYHYLVRANLSGVPAGSDITAASFTFNSALVSGTTNTSIYGIHDNNADWPEGTATDAAQAGSSCCSDHTYNNSVEWAGGACAFDSGTDYYATAYGSVSVAAVQWYTITINATGLVYLESKAGSNDAELVLITTSAPSVYFWGYTSEGALAYRPYLSLTYTPPSTAVPQVVTVGIF